MIQNVTTLKGIKCIYDADTIIIKKSYKISYDDALDFCEDLHRALPFKYKRTAVSWAKKLVVCNFLYAIAAYKFKSEDVNLSEHETALKKFGCEMLYILVKIGLVVGLIQ